MGYCSFWDGWMMNDGWVVETLGVNPRGAETGGGGCDRSSGACSVVSGGGWLSAY